MQNEEYEKLKERLGKKESVRNFQLIQDRIYHNSNKGMTQVLKKGQTLNIMYEHHDIPTAGHVGVRKMALAIKRKYWWPKMNEDIEKYVHSCLVCQQQGKQKKNNPIHGIVETASWQRVGIDFIRPLKESSKGNKYIITAIDYFTHWVEVKATPTASAKEAAIFIYKEIIC